MKTMNKNKIAIAAKGLRIIVPLGLALTCLSQQAAAVVNGTVPPGGGTLDPGGNTQSSYYHLPVGPGSGSGTNPNDYGMCGLLSLAGTFDNSTAVQIVVKDGYFNVYRRWPASQPDGPDVGWTCVRFTEFTGVPPSADAETFLPPAVETASGGALQKNNTLGNFQQACIWAGVAGSFSESPQGQASFAWAQFDSAIGNTLLWAQSAPGTTLSSSAICSTFKVSAPVWSYVKPSYWMGDIGTGGPPVNLSIPRSKNWCYMDGVGAIKPALSSGLAIGSTSYYEEIAKDDLLIYNCLPLKQ